MKPILANLVSYWVHYVALIVIAFFVSPIVVHELGSDAYGLWTLILATTGYLSVLDLGINAAVVRFVSAHVARADARSAQATYSTSLVLLGVLGATTFAALSVVAFLVVPRLEIASLTRGYVHAVFLVAALDIALGIVFAAFLGTLSALQQFVQTNAVAIAAALLKSIALVALLRAGHGLLAVALVQIAANVVKYGAQYVLIRRASRDLRFVPARFSRPAARSLLSYGAFGVLITAALKVKLYTDAVVVGECVSIGAVAFYAVPASILEQVERLAMAAIAVLTPVISGNDAVGQGERNRTLYVTGTRYALLAVMPVAFVLFTAGETFLGLWMGDEFAAQSSSVLRILAGAYLFSLPQLLAHGILKGTSRHRVLALILGAETLANVGLSILWVGDHGLRGVALATAVPLLVANLLLVPAYTCRVLSLRYAEYLRRSLAPPLLVLGLLALLGGLARFAPASYSDLALYAAAVTLVVAAGSWFALTEEHRAALRAAVQRLTGAGRRRS